MQGLAKTLFKNLEAVPNGAMSSHRCEDFLGGARKLERLSQDGERADFAFKKSSPISNYLIPID